MLRFIRPTSVCDSFTVRRAITACAFVVALASCNGIVRGLPVVASSGSLTTSANGAVLRLSERGTTKCATEEPNDVEVVIRLARAATGTFTIGKDASASLSETDPICHARRTDEATAGTVRVAHETSTSADGAYALTFGGDSLKGAFRAFACALPSGADIDAPECDDIDHNGEPGEQHSTGCGGGGGD